MSDAHTENQKMTLSIPEQVLKEKIFQAADKLFEADQRVDLAHLAQTLGETVDRTYLPHLQFWRLQKALSVAEKGGIVTALVESLKLLPEDVQSLIDQQVAKAVAAEKNADISKLQAKVAAQEVIVSQAHQKTQEQDQLLLEKQQECVDLENKLDMARVLGSDLVEQVDKITDEKGALEQQCSQLHEVGKVLEKDIEDLKFDLEKMRHSLDVAAEQASQSADKIDGLQSELNQQQELRKIALEETENMGQRLRLEGGWLLEDKVGLSDNTTRQLAVATMRIVELKAERDSLSVHLEDMRNVVNKTHSIMEKQVEMPQMFSNSMADNMLPPSQGGQQKLISSSYTDVDDDGPQIEIIR